ncbi:MAG: hypothetical protein GKR96_01540 [Gammaproteobacteria bacterium]|nr:hypothetical protein [Gammaproteobacteria bacterium]
MDSLAGWLLAMASFVVFWVVLPKSNRTPIIVLSGIFVLLAHHLLSFVNIAYGPLIFAKSDAWGFHLFAAKFAGDAEQLEWAIGTPMYKSLLLILYDWFGKSLWLGQSFSILCFSISAGLLIRVLRLLEVNNMVILAGAILMYGLTPSGLIYGSITLREPWMTLFFMLGSFLAIRGIQNQAMMDILIACCSWMIMGLFHQVMMIYGLVGAAGLILLHGVMTWRQQTVSGANGCSDVFLSRISFLLLVIFLFTFGLAIFFLLPSTGGDDYFAMIFDSIPQSVALYREAGESSNPTTGYRASFSFVDWISMLLSLTRSYFYYMGWPVTGNYQLMSTSVLMVGGILRMLGIVSVIVIWCSRKGSEEEHYRYLLLLLVIYVSLTFLWNVGTTNHGQALRHHMMTDWILLCPIAMFCQRTWSQRKTRSIASVKGPNSSQTIE